MDRPVSLRHEDQTVRGLQGTFTSLRMAARRADLVRDLSGPDGKPTPAAAVFLDHDKTLFKTLPGTDSKLRLSNAQFMVLTLRRLLLPLKPQCGTQQAQERWDHMDDCTHCRGTGAGKLDHYGDHFFDDNIWWRTQLQKAVVTVVQAFARAAGIGTELEPSVEGHPEEADLRADIALLTEAGHKVLVDYTSGNPTAETNLDFCPHLLAKLEEKKMDKYGALAHAAGDMFIGSAYGTGGSLGLGFNLSLTVIATRLPGTSGERARRLLYWSRRVSVAIARSTSAHLLRRMWQEGWGQSPGVDARMGMSVTASARAAHPFTLPSRMEPLPPSGAWG